MPGKGDLKQSSVSILKIKLFETAVKVMINVGITKEKNLKLNLLKTF